MADVSPETDLGDVFSTVANDTRFEILRALWEAHTENPAEISGPERDPVPFSRLRERVGIRDSGRFNYHLDELVPQFVQSREEGYALTNAGARIIGAAVSGIYTETDAELGTTTMGACTNRDCDGVLRAGYENGHVRISCDTCEDGFVMHAPPIVIEAHDAETNPEVFQQFALTEMQRTVRGFCGLCSGPVEMRIDRSDRPDDERIVVSHECRECGGISHTTAVMFVLDHPAVVSLLYEAGIDYRELELWKRPRAVDYEESIIASEPLRVAVTLTAGGETLTVVMDESLDVLEHHRGEP